MTQSNKIDAVEINTAEGGPAAPRPVTRDSGRVRIGGGAIHYSDAPVREPTKDAGKVRIGGGAIHF